MNPIRNQVAGVVSSAKIVVMALLVALLVTACATAPAPKAGPVFFPPPPSEPRVQFLKSVNSSRDVEPDKSGFTLLVTGTSEKDLIKPIIRPYGVKYIRGKLYICDTQSPPSVIIVDFKNKTFNYLKGNTNLGRLKKPINLAVDKDGGLFVADSLRQEILRYDAAGNYIGSIGKENLTKPVDVAVDDTSIFVLDIKGNDIKVFDRKTGQFEKSIQKNTDGTPFLSLPTNLTVDSKGLIHVTNVGAGNVVTLDKDGHLINTFGKLGDAFGEFTRPKGIAVDDKNRTWVVDGGFQNVQLFNENNRLLMFFGDPPLPAGALNLPAGITVTNEDLDYFQQFAAPDFVLEQVVFVTNQMGNDKISVYGFGHRKGAAETSPEAAGRKAD
ncbi:hypothetical protein F6V30_02520 [Oryzomonas sagensis]|uniref:NHL repeat-containing protein n=1 Tax=Oryzomonas sagensis TaxID=2603857 RepID=A0ABQ6TR02_9BACT|nr:hypothetical protein [Oryzomonas sagensis]KAB0671473.1 hypothetical protein F6V30_02520 [Oryzomonas sagensis]